jgi:hypothetical protein
MSKNKENQYFLPLSQYESLQWRKLRREEVHHSVAKGDR